MVKCHSCNHPSLNVKEVSIYTARYSETTVSSGSLITKTKSYSDLREHKYFMCKRCKFVDLVMWIIFALITLSMISLAICAGVIDKGLLFLWAIVGYFGGLGVWVILVLSFMSHNKLKRKACRERLRDYQESPKNETLDEKELTLFRDYGERPQDETFEIKALTSEKFERLKREGVVMDYKCL